ncbi:hypothetical protein WG66_006671 [Moniliophthora roreri]|nr:hypothetical protein WG66_006671 [Moniliophthora roreri]
MTTVLGRGQTIDAQEKKAKKSSKRTWNKQGVFRGWLSESGSQSRLYGKVMYSQIAGIRVL